jgi:hypothetical protein
MGIRFPCVPREDFGEGIVRKDSTPLLKERIDTVLCQCLFVELAHIVKGLRLQVCHTEGQDSLLTWGFTTSIPADKKVFRNLRGVTIPQQ